MFHTYIHRALTAFEYHSTDIDILSCSRGGTEPVRVRAHVRKRDYSDRPESDGDADHRGGLCEVRPRRVVAGKALPGMYVLLPYP